jgi:hypothetical protein
VLCTTVPQVQGASVVYLVPAEALGDELHAIEVESANDRPFTVNWVEMSIGPGPITHIPSDTVSIKEQDKYG